MTAELRALTTLARAASAGTADSTRLLARLCDGVAESFDLGCVAAYRWLPERGEVVPLGERQAPRPSRPVVEEALERRQPVWRDGRLVVPLYTDGPVGVLEAPCARKPGPDELELVAAYAAIVAGFVRRALEHEELERVNALKSQFITLASHELRAPAAVIHGIAKTLQSRADELSDKERRGLNDILAGHTESLTRLLDELLDISRLEWKAVSLNRVRLPIRERVEEVVHAVAGERENLVTVDVPRDLTAVVDPSAFDRIVANLITNALSYGSPPVQVRASQNDRDLRLTVEDRGAGVEPAFVPRLFERFSRSPVDAPKPGSGLGLSIAQLYAQAHGGRLVYEDATPHGACFKLAIPSARE